MAQEKYPITSLDNPYYSTYAGNPARMLVRSPIVMVLLFWGFHLPLGMVIALIFPLATAYAVLVTLFGVYVILKNQNPTHIVYVISYIGASETLWRERNLLHVEYSKFAVWALIIIAIIQQQRILKSDKRAILYMALLVPSIFVMPIIDQNEITFNLSGPVSLGLTIWFFSTVKLNRKEIRNLLFVIIGPICGLAMVALASIFLAGGSNLEFVGASNSYAAGSSGPNQVSAMLGFGAVAAFLVGILYTRSRVLQVVSFGLMGWFLIHSTLSFSRGGLYTGLGAIGVAAIMLMQDRRSRVMLVVFGGIASLVALFVIFPFLNSFTDGALTDRLADTDTTGRDVIFLVDIELFIENPVFGVGPGVSSFAHAEAYRLTRAHTEYSRLLAEHGMFGAGAIIILLSMVIPPLLAKNSPASRGLKFTMAAWGLVTISHIATRIIGPGIAFGLAIADLNMDEDEVDLALDSADNHLSRQEYPAYYQNYF